ncbi:MAG: hypothetical protein WC788_08010 [Candidatus Paceibacterota bacterium]|jgi:hypothetical protein
MPVDLGQRKEEESKNREKWTKIQKEWDDKNIDFLRRNSGKAFTEDEVIVEIGYGHTGIYPYCPLQFLANPKSLNYNKHIKTLENCISRNSHYFWSEE